MAKFVYTFRRYEKKYYITINQAEELIKRIGDRMLPDEHGETVICNLYYDDSNKSEKCPTAGDAC